MVLKCEELQLTSGGLDEKEHQQADAPDILHEITNHRDMWLSRNRDTSGLTEIRQQCYPNTGCRLAAEFY